MSELLAYLAVMNLFAAVAVAVVMALRLPVRRLFGARVAYGLWSLAPLAALALLLPARVVVVPARVAAEGPLLPPVEPFAVVSAAPALDVWAVVLAVWIAGGLLSLAWLAWRQHQFGRALRDGCAGPGVVGVLRPRIVTPSDFAGLYTAREQQVVLAHEATHIARNDARVNALVALARCVNWFNPLVHVAAHYLRIDQELACDAQVVAAHPQARRSYAEAMLKTQLAARPLPLGCHWPAQSAHPLADRIRLLALGDPGRARRRMGAAVVALLGLGVVGSAWAARPARVVLAPALVALAPPPATPAVRPLAQAAPRPAAPKPRPQLAAHVETETTPEAALAEAAPAPAPEAAPAPIPPPNLRPRVRGNMRPLIEPGSAVRVTATTFDPDGLPLTNDITSYGSNPLYRSGSYGRGDSRYGLYTSVFQTGDRYWVTASLHHASQPLVIGSLALRSGETGDLVLATGQVVTITATARAETPEEAEFMRDVSKGAVRETAWSGARARSPSTRYRASTDAWRARRAAAPIY